MNRTENILMSKLFVILVVDRINIRLYFNVGDIYAVIYAITYQLHKKLTVFTAGE